MEASGHQFERILDQFLNRFLMFFVKRGASSGDAKIIVLYWYLQYLVAIDLLKNLKKQKNVIKMWSVLREGCRHHFFIDFGSILTSILAPFLHVFDIFGNEFLSRFLTSTFEGILTENGPTKFEIWKGRRQPRRPAKLSKTAKDKVI